MQLQNLLQQQTKVQPNLQLFVRKTHKVTKIEAYTPSSVTPSVDLSALIQKSLNAPPRPVSFGQAKWPQKLNQPNGDHSETNNNSNNNNSCNDFWQHLFEQMAKTRIRLPTRSNHNEPISVAVAIANAPLQPESLSNSPSHSPTILCFVPAAIYFKEIIKF